MLPGEPNMPATDCPTSPVPGVEALTPPNRGGGVPKVDVELLSKLPKMVLPELCVEIVALPKRSLVLEVAPKPTEKWKQNINTGSKLV